jgi:hypothetical protein
LKLGKQLKDTLNQGAKLVTGGEHQGCNFQYIT